MKKINNIKSLSNYRLSESGILTQIFPEHRDINPDSKHIFILKDNNKTIKISLKTLYRELYNKEYCNDSIPNLPSEEWREIPNTKGKYFVSNCGRVKSYCKYNAVIL